MCFESLVQKIDLVLFKATKEMLSDTAVVGVPALEFLGNSKKSSYFISLLVLVLK